MRCVPYLVMFPNCVYGVRMKKPGNESERFENPEMTQRRDDSHADEHFATTTEKEEQGHDRPRMKVLSTRRSL